MPLLTTRDAGLLLVVAVALGFGGAPDAAELLLLFLIAVLGLQIVAELAVFYMAWRAA